MNTTTNQRKSMKKPLVAIIVGIIVGVLAFAGTASAWHINSNCREGTWVLSVPNESWANGTTATFDFDQGADATAGKGASVSAPAEAASVLVTFNNSDESFNLIRPEGCQAPVIVVAIPNLPLATTTTTTTLTPVITAPAEVITPVVVVAVADPPVPQTQEVSAGSQTLPVTGAGDTMFTIAVGFIIVGLILLWIAQRRKA